MPDDVKPTNLPAPTRAPLVGGGKIMPIVPESFEAAYRLARAIAQSGWVPKAYMVKEDGREVVNVDAISVAIMHGLEVGLTPMAALQSIAVINGMPTIFGDGALGLVQASGLLEDIEETIEHDDSDKTKPPVPVLATCRIKRVDRKQWVMQTFTRAEAQKAGLWSKAGPWTSYPRRMMQMRARAWALRDTFPDVLRGLRIHEEMQDIVDVTPGDGSQPPPPEPRRADFRQPVTDVADERDQQQGQQQPTDSTGGQPAGASADAPTSQDGDASSAEAAGPRDWSMPPEFKTIDERGNGICDMIMRATAVGDFDDIEATHKSMLADWRKAKPGSAFGRWIEAIDAAKARRAKELAGE